MSARRVKKLSRSVNFQKGLLAQATNAPVDSLRRVVAQFLEHYHGERNHQGLGNEIIAPGNEVGQVTGAVRCRERVGGMLRYYYRDAA